jgi:CheY-like chemotaxis protein
MQPHILVIGDEPGIWDVTRAALGREGYRLSRALSVDALSRLRQDQPDLAIVDSALRQPSALEVAAEARRCAVPVLLTTDDRGLDAPLAELNLPCLRRPFPERELLERSRQLIAEVRQRHGLLRQSRQLMRTRIDELHSTIDHVRRTMARLARSALARRGARYDFRADAILREALDYWQRKRGERLMPQRRDIDPAELPFWLLPHVELVDVVEGGRRFRHRLVGTAIVGALGSELTGKYLDEVLSGVALDVAHTAYRAVCDAKRAAFLRSTHSTVKGSPLTAHRVLLPLADDGTVVNMILGAATFELALAPPPGDAQSSGDFEIMD